MEVVVEGENKTHETAKIPNMLNGIESIYILRLGLRQKNPAAMKIK